MLRKLLHCICINYEMKYQILRNMGVWTISVSYSRLLCAHFYLLFSLRHKISISFLKSPAVYSCVWLTDNHEILSWLKQLTAMNSVVHTKFYLIVEAKNLILTNFVHFVNLNYFWNLKHLVIPLLYTGLCQHQAVTPIFFPHTSACL